MIIEPVSEKTNNLGSDQVRHKPGCTVTRLEIWDLESRGIVLTIRVAKTKALIAWQFNTVKFAYADCWFSHAEKLLFTIHACLIFVQAYTFFLPYTNVT